MKRRLVLVLIAVALLAGGSVTAGLLLRDGGSGGASAESLAALSARLGCTGLEQETEQTELFVREQGRCQFSGGTVTLYTFNSDEAQAGWVDVAARFGGVMVVGQRWAVSVVTPAAGDQVRAKIGGQVR